MNYYFLHDTSSGVIENQPMLATSNPWPNPPATWSVLDAGDQNTASSQTVMAFNFPERFLVQNGALVEQPYFTLASAEANGEYVLTATLNNPPAQPPTEVTFTVAGQALTAPIANNVATLTIALHPSVANAPITATAGATGCATSRSLSIGGSTAVSVGLQVYTPSGGVPTVAPTGAGSRAFLEGYYALSPASLESLLADIGTAINLLADTVFNVLLPAAQQAAYAPVVLDANQANAYKDIQTNVLPSVFTKLENAYPSGGSQSVQYAHFVKDLQKTFQNFEDYSNDLSTIPNLA